MNMPAHDHREGHEAHPSARSGHAALGFGGIRAGRPFPGGRHRTGQCRGGRFPDRQGDDGSRLRRLRRNTGPQAGRCPDDHGAHAPGRSGATAHASHQSRLFPDDPGGVALFWIGTRTPASAFSPGAWTAGALAFSAGTFLCIALSDLLPELQFHSHDRLKLSIALLAGFALMAVTAGLEPDSHLEAAPPIRFNSPLQPGIVPVTNRSISSATLDSAKSTSQSRGSWPSIGSGHKNAALHEPSPDQSLADQPWAG